MFDLWISMATIWSRLLSQRSDSLSATTIYERALIIVSNSWNGKITLDWKRFPEKSSTEDQLFFFSAPMLRNKNEKLLTLRNSFFVLSVCFQSNSCIQSNFCISKSEAVDDIEKMESPAAVAFEASFFLFVTCQPFEGVWSTFSFERCQRSVRGSRKCRPFLLSRNAGFFCLQSLIARGKLPWINVFFRRRLNLQNSSQPLKQHISIMKEEGEGFYLHPPDFLTWLDRTLESWF